MTVEIITKSDLEEFKKDLLKEIKSLLAAKPISQEKWLKGSEVRALLKISPSTLQNLRISGVLKFSKVGNTLYYQTENIQKLLEGKEKSWKN